MKIFKLFLCGIYLFSYIVNLSSESFESLKDPDVLYFDGDLNSLPVDQVRSLIPLYTDKNLRSLLRHLPAETRVRLLGWHSQGWLVQVIDERNSSEGWIAINAIPGLSSEKLNEWREVQRRKKEIEAAISDRKIIPGMTVEEVRKTLGKPNQSSFRVDEKGRREVWGYIRYENVPQTRLVKDAFGNWVQMTSLIRVPKGEILVEFQEGKVVAYEEKK